ncbi:hypothetical protein D1AOALGA4SA_10243 [Olavius algarvensis Delta 1 endosymbiont]|nr:hypothetical protein D1AOALGA4SA_10243 [Olavius algarvensis Delta 1 endosymbiont]
MSFFMSGLSFSAPQQLDFSKLGIILASLICGVSGFIVLSFYKIAPVSTHPNDGMTH